MIIALGNNRYRCDICGLVISTTALPIICCTTGQSRTKGVGDFVHDSIVRLFGEGITEGCGCQSKITEMNQLGPAGCRKQLPKLAAYLSAKANEKKWFKEPTPDNKRRFRWWKLATKLPGEIVAIEMMILHAIRQVEKATISVQ